MKSSEMEAVAEAIVVTVKAALQPLKSEITALRAEVATLRVTPKSLDYHGIWQRAAMYCRNEAATHKSAIWVCVADTSRGNEPGNSPDWQLAQKAER